MIDCNSAALSADGVWHSVRLLSHPGPASLAVLENAAIVVQDGSIVWTGVQSDLPARFAALPRYEGANMLATPGLIDCHTHLVYGGQRASEFASRLAGASYEEVTRAGGGIISTVRATRDASEQQLYDASAQRLQELLAEGVCAIEVKSGYGLSLEHERKQLRVARRLAQAYDVTVKTTFLGAHALPPEYAGRGNEYIQRVCEEMLPILAEEKLIDAVDVFCENIAFDLNQTEQVFRAAQALNLPVKLHAEQLSNMEGAALAASYGALSCDHLEHLSAKGIDAMRAAGTVAVLLPGAYYALRDTHLPPVQALREAGVPIAVSTDHNPGTSPALSLLLMINMACTLFRLTVPEAIAAVTTHAALALGLQHNHGTIAVGQPANFVLWRVSDVAELAYWFGQRPVAAIVRQGKIRMLTSGRPV